MYVAVCIYYNNNKKLWQSFSFILPFKPNQINPLCIYFIQDILCIGYIQKYAWETQSRIFWINIVVWSIIGKIPCIYRYSANLSKSIMSVMNTIQGLLSLSKDNRCKLINSNDGSLQSTLKASCYRKVAGSIPLVCMSKCPWARYWTPKLLPMCWSAQVALDKSVCYML